MLQSDFLQWNALLVEAVEAIQTALSAFGEKPSPPGAWELYFIRIAIKSVEQAAEFPHTATSTFYLLRAVDFAEMSALPPAERSATISIPNIGSQVYPQLELAGLTDAFELARARCAGWLQPTRRVRHSVELNRRIK